MPTPSLLIVPARFKTGRLYSQIPTSGAGDFTVTRNTEARRFDSAGLIASVASGIPRLDYYTSGGVTGCPALLVEPSSQNFCKESQAIPTGNTNEWTHVFGGNSITVTPNSTGSLDPAGLNNADLIVAPATTEGHSLFTNGSLNLTSLTSGTNACWSFFVKSNSNTPFCRLSAGGMNLGTSPSANFQLSGNGSVTVSAGTNVTPRIESYGNGWYRVSIGMTAGASGTPQCAITPILASGTTGSFTGNAADGLWVWGAQFETGTLIPTSYIPTTTGSVTRNADVISVSGAVSGSIGQTEGTMYFDFQASPSGTSSNWLNISDGSANNWLFIGKDSNKCRGYLRANNVVIFSDTSFTLTGSSLKAALAYKSGDYAFYINGNIIASGTTAFTFSAALRSIHTGADTPSVSYEISRYRAVALYTTRLTNSELAALTSP